MMNMDRRLFLKFGAVAAAGLMMPNQLFGMGETEDFRSLSFYNIHTGESLRTTYWEEGIYIPEALEEINHLLRDYRTGEAMPMDRGVIDLLYAIRTKTGNTKPFRIISGYRSPKTNAMLNKNTSGVAKKSLHMQGKAIDINLPGTQLADLRKVAMHLKSGGVGFYPKSGFVHVDVGRVRYW
jgi:uncharacterized protein YcbK (DUF882 family)